MGTDIFRISVKDKNASPARFRWAKQPAVKSDPVGGAERNICGRETNEQRIVRQLPLRVKQERRTSLAEQQYSSKGNKNRYSHGLSGKKRLLIVSDPVFSVNGMLPIRANSSGG